MYSGCWSRLQVHSGTSGLLVRPHFGSLVSLPRAFWSIGSPRTSSIDTLRFLFCNCLWAVALASTHIHAHKHTVSHALRARPRRAARSRVAAVSLLSAVARLRRRASAPTVSRPPGRPAARLSSMPLVRRSPERRASYFPSVLLATAPLSFGCPGCFHWLAKSSSSPHARSCALRKYLFSSSPQLFNGCLAAR